MKKLSIILVILLCLSLTFAFGAKKKANDVELISQTDSEIVLKFKLTSYKLKDVVTPRGQAKKIDAENTFSILKKGVPDLNKLVGSIVIPDRAEMTVEVISSKFKTYQNVDIAPSKGKLYRNKNPELVPYEYGDEYDTNAFFPENIVELGNPYIIRTVRGVAVTGYPFQYNPVTKELKVYKEIIVKISDTGAYGMNTLPASAPKHYSQEFENVFSRHFLNYPSDLSQPNYTQLMDPIGKMLIVSYGAFMGEMAPFVSWKQSIGYTVTMVDYATIGSSAALKTYVANFYNTSGLDYLLLVGDHPQVPVSSTSAGDSDNNYGYIVGGDHYQDIFVGRFSAETGTQVTTQVDRTIHYERDVSPSATFFKKCVGMGSSEGPGHNSEYDYVHINNIGADCTGYGYTYSSCHQSGGSAALMSSLINAGTGTIFYCGHGTVSSWYTSSWQYTSTHVNALTNEWELPFNVNVACVNGDFRSNTCYSEVWQRATNNGNPTGAIANCGSTINQSWNPPMDAEDEMYDLLCATAVRTFGGFFVNGMFKMNDINGSAGDEMTDTWVCFGDSSVQLRTPGTPNGPSSGPTLPPVADFIGTPTTVDQGQTVAFTDLSSNTPTSWSWTFQGGTPATSTLKNPVVTYNTLGTFDVTLKATNSAGSDTKIKYNYITVVVPSCNYCTSSGNNQNYEWIAGVSVGTLNNPSGPSGYTDYTHLTANLTAGGLTNVSLTPGFASSSYTEYWRIWIDYNGDCDFADAGEQVFSGSGSGLVSGNFTVPSSAAGTITRMRVSMSYSTYAPYCGTFTYGEVEDYTVNIL
jgi:PKD repeat protein